MPAINSSQFVGGNASFDYQKTFATTYNYSESYTNGTIKVTYRNGTVALFNNSVSIAGFKSYVVAPTSYFLWNTLTIYADGTQQLIYSNFTTMLIGPSIPVLGATPTSSDLFTLANIQNTGLVYSM